jgi:hypothetical protein
MKIFTSLVWLLICAVPVVAQSSKVTFTEKVAYNTSLTPNAAVTNAWNWFDNYTKVATDAKEAKLRNERGMFTGVSSFRYVSNVASGNDYSRGTIYYTIRLKINEADGSYTYEITDFAHQARVSLNAITTDEKYPYKVSGDKMWHNMVWKDIKQQINQHAKELATSLKASMQAPSVISHAKKGPVIIVVKN